MPSLTRGPLPARVYWRRRLLLLGSALLLVFAFARLLGAGSDGSSAPEAAQVAADESPSSSVTTPAAATPTLPVGKPGELPTSAAPVLAEPDGPCSDRDIAVSPDVKDAVAGRDVTIRLHLRTLESEACTWKVSPRTLTLKITSGPDDIWSTRQCPRAVPTQEVVVRRDTSTSFDVTWHDAKRSDDACSPRTEWALPGYYNVEVAALAGEPADEQFQLKAPTAPVITRSPSPHQAKQSGRPVTPSDSASAG